jgi:hypothetical protein
MTRTWRGPGRCGRSRARPGATFLSGSRRAALAWPYGLPWSMAGPPGHRARSGIPWTEDLTMRTQCLTMRTQCLTMRTQCLTMRTQCLTMRTQCLTMRTQCLTMRTQCLTMRTQCLTMRTQCLTMRTQCLTMRTQCLTMRTQCLTMRTQCLTIWVHWASAPAGPHPGIAYDHADGGCDRAGARGHRADLKGPLMPPRGLRSNARSPSPYAPQRDRAPCNARRGH